MKTIISKILVIILLAANLMVLTFCDANIGKGIFKSNLNTEVQFKDINLENAIRNAINQPYGKILLQKVKNIKSLTLKSQNIKELDGIENLTSLTCINLNYNKVSNLEPLSKLTRLTLLKLDYNNISDLTPLGNLKNLKSLYLKNNNITGIQPLAGLSKLSFLQLSYNNISDITHFSKLVNLKTLYLRNNKISDISALSNLTRLVDLDIGNDSEKYNPDNEELGLFNLSFDKRINCNNIKSIKAIGSLKALQKLSLNSNQIEDIEDLSNNSKLEFLDISSNKIRNFNPLKYLKNIYNLNIAGNLHYLDITGNPDINDYSYLKNLTNLMIFSADYCDSNSLQILESFNNLINVSVLGTTLIESGTEDKIDYSVYKKILDKAHEIININIKPGMSDYEKEKAIFDYFVKNRKYDFTNKRISHSSYGALLNDKAVCNGFASAYSLIMDMLGIECIEVGSIQIAHEWNIVKLDNDYYHVDISRTISRGITYFNQTDADFKVSHSYDQTNFIYPKCNGVKYKGK